MNWQAEPRALHGSKSVVYDFDTSPPTIVAVIADATLETIALMCRAPRLQQITDAAVNYVQHQKGAMLVGVGPLTEDAYTKRRMVLRNELHAAVDAYINYLERNP